MIRSSKKCVQSLASAAKQVRAIASLSQSTKMVHMSRQVGVLSHQAPVFCHNNAVVAPRFKYSPYLHAAIRSYATDGEVLTVNVPAMGDSIADGTLVNWHKKIGEAVNRDDPVAALETDKVTMDVRTPESGVIVEHLGKEGEKLLVGQPLFKVKVGAQASAAAPQPSQPKEQAKPAQAQSQPQPTTTTPLPQQAAKPSSAPQPAAAKPAAASVPAAQVVSGARTETRVPMTRMRKRIAERLKGSQNTYALLTTFNEIDMTNLMELRNTYKDSFEKKHKVKLGFMSAFVKASAHALAAQPVVNAVIDGDDIVYRDYVDISVAVATPTGLVVPVIRDCNKLSFADVEKTIGNLGERAKTGSITLEEMQGGTFTISNGGVFGSMFGTPIVNPPQSAILGMHAVTKRAVVVGDKIEARPVMYVALTYDHKLIDGREAVTFLKTIKELIEDPRRMLLDL